MANITDDYDEVQGLIYLVVKKKPRIEYINNLIIISFYNLLCEMLAFRIMFGIYKVQRWR